ncbi:MAG: gamma-glutamyltransferase [Candidatus Izemoplasmatales bacterium]|nr:gamma-glutamyltransferase [Candidatus Izemoplasmatales bacterium]
MIKLQKRLVLMLLFLFVTMAVIACEGLTTLSPTTQSPTTELTATPTTPTTVDPTTAQPTTGSPTTLVPSTGVPTTQSPTTIVPTTLVPTTMQPTTSVVTTAEPNYHDLSVRDAFGENGMVATASSYASKVGVDILKAGGNAFDAAVAIGFALNVTEPNASGVGGGGLLIGYQASSGDSFVYDYREFAPAAATRERYLQGDIQTGDGPGSFGIPMFVDGMLTVLEDYGTMSREEVIGPAIELARYGFEIPYTLADNIQSNFTKLMRSRTEALKIYSSDGFSAIGEGEILINTDLANVLDLIVTNGREGFYTGDLALAIVSAVQNAGGIVTMADMQRAIGLTEKMDPVSGTYKDYEIFSMMPPGSGISIVEYFNLLEQYNALHGDITQLEHNSAEYIHAIASMQQLMYGDRRKYTGDPAFVDVPLWGMISKDYAATRIVHYDPLVGKTFTGAAEYGDPWPFDIAPASGESYIFSEGSESGSTTHFTIMDSEGNIVSATHTINYFFGNGIIPPGTGIHLNNILSPFSTTLNSPACIAPYKQPLSSMAPTIVLKNGEPFMSIGSPGSLRIPAAIVQTMINVMDFGMDIQTAIEKPRVYHYAATNMEIEGAIGTAVINALRNLGYNPQTYYGTNLYFGGVHAIVLDPDTGIMHGGADRRRDGKALGY